MHPVISTHVSPFRSLLLVSGFLLCLCSACNQSKREIPEPDYNPYVLKPPVYIEAKQRVRNTMPPPDTIRVKGQWKIAQESNESNTNLPMTPAPDSLTAMPVAVEMSEFNNPNFVQSSGTRHMVSLPAGIPAQGAVDSPPALLPGAYG
jgi:hypothetical protein